MLIVHQQLSGSVIAGLSMFWSLAISTAAPSTSFTYSRGRKFSSTVVLMTRGALSDWIQSSCLATVVFLKPHYDCTGGFHR